MFVKNPEYFLTIAKEHSISKAAERLYQSVQDQPMPIAAGSRW